MWLGENPHEYHKSTLHSEKIRVWCGMSGKRIVWPIFFTSTITGHVNQDIIQQFVSQLEKSEHRSWLQQDNARPHVSTNTKSFLRKIFNKYLISTNLRPPHSPDLSPLTFFYRATWKITFITWPRLGILKNRKEILHGRLKISIKNSKTCLFVFTEAMSDL